MMMIRSRIVLTLKLSCVITRIVGFMSNDSESNLFHQLPSDSEDSDSIWKSEDHNLAYTLHYEIRQIKHLQLVVYRSHLLFLSLIPSSWVRE